MRDKKSTPAAKYLTRLQQTRGFVFDMDGTLVLGDQKNHGLRALPGALEITRYLSDREIPFVIYTNGTARPPAIYAESLRQAGFALADAAMMTPASSAADLFACRGYRRVMVMGGEGVAGPLRDVGIEVVRPEGKQEADAVLVGWYPEVSFAAVEAACHCIWAGAKAFSVSQVRFFATAEGKALGTSRAISAMLRDLTGCRINLVGKPSIHAIGSAGHRLGTKLKDMAVVGDDPDLEVPMAHRGKALAIAVNTGLGKADSFDHLPRDRHPHLSVHGVDELLAMLKANGGRGR